MKKTMLLICIFFALSCSNQKNEHTSVISSDSNIIIHTPPASDSIVRDESIIESIRKKVQAINLMSLLVQNFEFRQEGCVDEGKIAFYQSNDTTYKIIENGFIGDGGWTKEYYYFDGKFIFSYMQSIGGPAGMPVDTSEIREYVNSDTLVLLKRNQESLTNVKLKWTGNSKEYKLLHSLKNKDFAKVLCN